jgi:hypothetical protein
LRLLEQASLDPSSPLRWITPRVPASSDQYLSIPNRIHHSIREAVEHCPAQTMFDDLILKWIAFYCSYRRVEFALKIFIESRPVVPVPGDCRREIAGDGRMKTESTTHLS